MGKRAGVAQAVQALFEGQPLNLTEGRAVLHMALRADASDVFEVDGQSVVSDVMKERERCLPLPKRSAPGRTPDTQDKRLSASSILALVVRIWVRGWPFKHWRRIMTVRMFDL